MEAFKETYDTLLTTLVETYQDKDLANYRRSYDVERARQQFYDDIAPNERLVLSHDESLFDEPLTSLQLLTLPELWRSNRLSPKSKSYIWGYLSDLLRNSQPISTSQRDIAPLTNVPQIPDMAQSIGMIYQNLPPSILDNVKRVADKYGSQIESGEKSMDSIKFEQISQELFSSMSQEDMTGLVNNVGSMLQSIMKQQPLPPR